MGTSYIPPLKQKKGSLGTPFTFPDLGSLQLKSGNIKGVPKVPPYAVDDTCLSWHEQVLVWTNKPYFDTGDPLVTVTTDAIDDNDIVAGDKVALGITDYVAAKGDWATVALWTTDSDTQQNLVSMENGNTSMQPRLVITTSP